MTSCRNLTDASCVCVVLFAIFLGLAGCAKDETLLLKREGTVNDFAGVLSEETRMSLSSEIDQYERETCHQLVVLIVQSLKGESIKDLSTRIAISWEIGYPTLNNGILLTIAVDEGQARIVMGLSLESILNKDEAEAILKNVMFPYFRAQDIDKGVLQGVNAIMQEAKELDFPDELRPSICRKE